MKKQCKACGESKPLSAYNPHRTTKDNLQGTCKVCQSAYNKAYYLKNQKELREKHRVYWHQFKTDNKQEGA